MKPRRVYEWAGGTVRGANIALGGAKTFGTIAPQGQEAQTALTLVRSRGNGMFFLDPGAVGDVMEVALGLIIVSSDAFAAGVASVPGPLSDLDAEWIFHTVKELGPGSLASQAEDSLVQVHHFEIDSKAQRKLKPGDVVAMVFEGAIHAGAPTVDVSASVRTLLMLS